MSKYRLTHRVTRDQIELWCRSDTCQCVCAVHTPWWSLWDDLWLPYRLPGSCIPCDPRGSVLTQGSLVKMWSVANDNREHYGRHGIEALVAAFHSNVEVLTADCRGWRPTSLNDWEAYNDLLDRELAKVK